MNEKVQILLSTYNGEKYLREQLESLFAQDYGNLKILVRDDGSSDGSVQILEEFSKRDSRLRFYVGSNLGVVDSFFDLLKKADSEATYFFFCDQDDVWVEGKVSRAVERLSRKTMPALYFSRLRYVSESLAPLGTSKLPRNLSFASALVENVATGCTVAFNQALRAAALAHLPTQHCLMHDWWMYLLALATGQVVYDDQSFVAYRQHGANVVGASSNALQIYSTKVARFWTRYWRPGTSHLSDQARVFDECYRSLLKPSDRNLLEFFLDSKKSLIRRLKFAVAIPTRRQSWLDTQILRILVIFGRY